MQIRRKLQLTFPAMVPSSPGFTLLELLLAVLLLGMVSTMIYSVLNVGIRFTDRGEERILVLDRQQGFLNLLHSQIRAATYDNKLEKPTIIADGELLRMVTRYPLNHDFPGLVLALYRYNAGDQTLYYMEKKDYYNIDYQEDYVPDFADMRPLLRTSPGGMVFSYDEETFTVTLSYQDVEYLFSPKCGEPRPLPQEMP